MKKFLSIIFLIAIIFNLHTSYCFAQTEYHPSNVQTFNNAETLFKWDGLGAPQRVESLYRNFMKLFFIERFEYNYGQRQTDLEELIKCNSGPKQADPDEKKDLHLKNKKAPTP